MNKEEVYNIALKMIRENKEVYFIHKPTYNFIYCNGMGSCMVGINLFDKNTYINVKEFEISQVEEAILFFEKGVIDTMVVLQKNGII